MKAPILHGENREIRHLLSSITTVFSLQRYGIPGSFLGGRQPKQREKQQRCHQHAPPPPQVDEFPASIGRPRRRAAVQTTGSTSTNSTMDTTRMIHSSSSSNNNNNSFTNFATQQPLHRCQDSNPDTSEGSLECLHSNVLDSSSHHDHAPPRVFSFEFLLICNIYIHYAARFFKQHCQRIRRIVIYFVGFVLTAAVLVVAWCALDFYRNATRLCTPPPQAEVPVYDSADRHLFAASGNGPNPNFRPLVEYFVHGRGMGHYARSVVIVEELNKAGVDVRQFIAKTATRNALHEEESSNNLVDDEDANPKNQPQLGTTRTISVASITPSMNFFSSVYQTMERVLRDCEVAANSNRYPSLIISDGDMPGMLRAYFGGIPSISISHGQLFRIARKPSWINKNRALNRSWNKQGRLNGLASYFSDWQIATHFCFLESKLANGVVAQAPLRAEVLTMAQTRKMAHRGQFQSDSQSMPQIELVKDLLLIESTPDLQHLENRQDQEATTTASKKVLIPPAKRRKVVICYFRDCNGGAVVDVLLDSDFDVLVFGTCNITDAQTGANRYVTQTTYGDAQVQSRGNTVDGNTANNNNSTQHSPVVSSDKSGDANSVSEHWKLFGDIMSNNVNDGDDHPRLIRVVDRSLFVPLMHVADGVASSAGSQLMSECIYSDMPLLAMYLEHDDEQRMNVELSSHSEYCPTKPQVYGTSFEFLNSAVEGKSDQLRRRNNHDVTPANATEIVFRTMWGGGQCARSSESDHARQEIGRFVMAVRGSPVSEAFYENSAQTMTREASADDTTINDSTTTDEGEKGVEGRLPEAAVIILEILKKVKTAG